MDTRTADILHEKGLMPTWAWVQQNGRTPEQNWEYQRREMMEKIENNRREQQQKEALEKYVSEMVEDKLEECFEKVLGDLLKDFK